MNRLISQADPKKVDQDLSTALRKLPSRFVIRQGKILMDLKTVCNFAGVDYVG